MTKNLFKLATLLLLLCGAFINLNAQVTVGANTAPNATLDVVHDDASSTLSGVIAPNVDRQYLNDKDGTSPAVDKYGTAQEGAIVYVGDASTGTATNQAANVTSAGYYYFDGAVWQALGGGGAATTYTVTPVLTELTVSAYVIQPTDIYVALNIRASGETLQLPTTDVPVGRIIYLSNVGNRAVSVSPAFRNNAFSGVDAGASGAVIYKCLSGACPA